MSPSAAETVNNLPRPELVEQLLECLNVRRWAEAVADQRPFHRAAEVYEAAERAGSHLDVAEIHSALAAHPRIGDRSDSPQSRDEQSGVGEDAALRTALRRNNEEYERRFGHVYLVCASGRSGDELLTILRSRLDNDPDTELAIVAEELRKIARLRLAKVVEQ